MVWDPSLPHVTLLYRVNLIATGLSLAGSSTMSYLCLKTKNKTVAWKLIMAVALSDFFYSVSNLMSAFEDNENGILCHTDAFIRKFSYIYSIFWVTCTSVLCYKSSKSLKSFNQQQFFNRAALIGFLICLTITLSPLYTNKIVYGNGAIFCGITAAPTEQSPNERLLLLIAVDGGPIIVGVIITLFGYIFAIKNVKNASEGLMEHMEINIYKLLWYPALMFITFMPGLIDNIIMLYLDADTPIGFELVHLTLTHSIGFTNAIVYGLQRGLYQSKHSHRKTSDRSMNLSTNTNNACNSVTQNLIHAGVDDF